MKRLEWLKDNTVELTEEQKEFDSYDNELLNNILSTPNSTPKSEPKPANKLDDMEIQLADDDEMDELFGKPNTVSGSTRIQKETSAIMAM